MVRGMKTSAFFSDYSIIDRCVYKKIQHVLVEFFRLKVKIF